MKKIITGIAAVLATLLIVSVGLTIIDLPDRTKEITPQTIKVSSANTTHFQFYAQNDPRFNIEAYRVLVPKGWKIQGDVEWNYASVNAPAMYSMQAFSPDGKAGIAIISDMHFATLQYSGGMQMEASAYGVPAKAPTQPNVLAQELLTNMGYSDIRFSASKNIDKDGKIFREYLLPGLNKMKSQLAGTGQSIEKPYLNIIQLSGTVSLNGESKDIKVLITTTGYQIVARGSLISQTANIWQTGGMHISVAPAGRIGEYEKDLATIESNFTVNKSWTNARAAVSSEIYRMLRERQISDWRQANAMSEILSARVDAIIERTNNYKVSYGSGSNSDSSGSKISLQDKFSEYLFDENTFDAGDGERIKVDSKYDYLWRGKDGTVIATDRSDYNPNIGSTVDYEQLRIMR